MIEEKVTKKIVTPHFGELEIKEDYLFNFENGILGFEDLKEYILVSEEDTEPFKWLISVDEPEIGFPILNPYLIDSTYKYGKQSETDQIVPFVVITLGGEEGNITANMKAPVILDLKEQKGEQIILPSDKYSPNFILKSNEKKGKK